MSLDHPAVALDLPRKNGELVFEAPWEGRAFGMAVALTSDGRPLEWDDFRSRLIAEIAEDPDHPYYEQWLEAFESLVTDRGLVSVEELERRAEEFRSQARDEVF